MRSPASLRAIFGLVLSTFALAACTKLDEEPVEDAGSDSALDDEDAGFRLDASRDSSVQDAGISDAGSSDAGLLDGGRDAGPADAGPTPRRPIKQIVINDMAGCAVYVDGSLKCWGDRRLVGTRVSSAPAAGPILIGNAQGATFGPVLEVSGVYRTLLARDTTGKAWGWGFNDAYQVGDWTRNSSPSEVDGYARPVKLDAANTPVIGALAATQPQAGNGGNASCYVPTDGSVLCWGSSGHAILKRAAGATSANSFQPLPILAITAPAAGGDDRLKNVASISVAAQHACALLNDGTVACWGSNSSGLLGAGAGPDPARPVLVQGLTNVLTVSAGATSTCALKNDGTVWCWGQNNYGQIGRGGATGGSALVPEQAKYDRSGVATPFAAIAQISVGDQHACVVDQAGLPYCWGSNSLGRLGVGNDGTQTNTANYTLGTRVVSSVATNPATLMTNVRKVVTGDTSAVCALMNDDQVFCWGSGSLGSKTISKSFTPIAVEGL